MPNPNWPDRTIAQLSLIGSAFGNQIVNVHHFQAEPVLEATFTSDAVAKSAAATLAADWQTNLLTTWRACHPPEYSLTMIRCQVLERPLNFRHRLTPTELTLSSGNNGTVTYNAESNTGAGVIRWRSALAGKRFRGRSYVGPVANDHATDGRLAADYVSRLQAYATAMDTRYFVGGIPVDTWVLCIYSRAYNLGEYGYPTGHHPNKTFHYPNEYPGNAENVIDYAIDPVLRVQRRRELGVGA